MLLQRLTEASDQVNILHVIIGVIKTSDPNTERTQIRSCANGVTDSTLKCHNSLPPETFSFLLLEVVKDTTLLRWLRIDGEEKKIRDNIKILYLITQF